MSKKNKNTYVKKDKEINNKNKEHVYSNPANSRVGKIIIVSLALLMALSGLITLIYLMVTM